MDITLVQIPNSVVPQTQQIRLSSGSEANSRVTKQQKLDGAHYLAFGDRPWQSTTFFCHEFNLQVTRQYKKYIYIVDGARLRETSGFFYMIVSP